MGERTVRFGKNSQRSQLWYSFKNYFDQFLGNLSIRQIDEKEHYVHINLSEDFTKHHGLEFRVSFSLVAKGN